MIAQDRPADCIGQLNNNASASNLGQSDFGASCSFYVGLRQSLYQ